MKTNAIGLMGIPVVLSDLMYDGEILLSDSQGSAKQIFLGTGPLSDKEWCRREARRIVHEGLADVLAWLSERHTPPRTHQQILQSWRVGT
jgi:hypothetical protein